MSQDPDDGGEIIVLGLLEAMRAEYDRFKTEASHAYSRLDELARQLSNTNLPDIPIQMPFRIELWDRHNMQIRWIIAACSTISVAHGAFDAAIRDYPNYKWLLRNGALIIRKHNIT